MFLKKISLINFKNFDQEEFSFDRGINCFVGDNGVGKTNVIDAIYYLSMCKSSLTMTDAQSVKHGKDFFLVEGQYITDGGKGEQILCSYAKKAGSGSKVGKVVKRNGKEYERLSEHVGLAPVVIVSPSDVYLISDAAEERRRYINGFVSQLDRSYMNALIRYNAVIAERNKVLKMGADPTMLTIYDEQLVLHGGVIHERRAKTIDELKPLVAKYYEALSQDREQVELIYKSELNTTPFAELLQGARQKDIINEYTTVGIHRDDLTLKIGGYPLRKYGSQGQQKSFLVALKLAQYSIISKHLGERAILLLDDLFDKLDAGRVEQLMQLVSEEEFGQIFISDCDTRRITDILEKISAEHKMFKIEPQPSGV